MGRMKEIWSMHNEGYSIEYIALVMKTDSHTIRKLIYSNCAPHINNFKKGSEEE